MPLTFNEQVCIELLKGCFILLGVVIGGVYANRALERFKSEQALHTQLRRQQYDALSALLGALARVETAFDDWHDHASHGRDEAARARELLASAHGEAETAVDVASYLLGDVIGNQAIALLNFFTEREAVPPSPLDDDHYEKLTELRAPLIALLPPLPTAR